MRTSVRHRTFMGPSGQMSVVWGRAYAEVMRSRFPISRRSKSTNQAASSAVRPSKASRLPWKRTAHASGRRARAVCVNGWGRVDHRNGHAVHPRSRRQASAESGAQLAGQDGRPGLPLSAGQGRPLRHSKSPLVSPALEGSGKVLRPAACAGVLMAMVPLAVDADSSRITRSTANARFMHSAWCQRDTPERDDEQFPSCGISTGPGPPRRGS